MDTHTVSRTAAPPRILLLATFCLSTGLAMFAVTGCKSAPVSERRQLMLIPESQEIEMGVEAYAQTLSDEPISTDADVVAMVERVGQRIAAVANKPEYEWEFKVIAKDVQNAFALPGGKVAVYEGILPVCQDEAGLAVVMSHEVAHALARHGGERMSQQAAVQGLGTVVNAVANRKTGETTSQRIMQVYGVGSKYGVVLPFSRKHESEADAIGLILMAKAGYDPSAAPEFWQRFSATSGEKPPEWLSTHPADARRAADLRALLPEAMKYYEATQEQLGLGEPIPFTPRGTQLANTSSGEARTVTAASFTFERAAKKGQLVQAVHEVFTDEEETANLAACEDMTEETDSLWNLDVVRQANFQLPRKAGVETIRATSASLSNVDSIDSGGWEPSTGRAHVTDQD